MNKRKSDGMRPWIKILLNLTAMLVIAILLMVAVMHWIKGYTMHGQQIQVPSVIGMTEDEMDGTLQAFGLEYEITDARFDAEMPAGAVIEQKPAAGSFVKLGRKIYLTVNSGSKPTRALPDLAGNSSLREAQSRLRAAGFNLGEVEYVEGDRGWVYQIKYMGDSIPAGTLLPEGCTLTIVAGNGDDITILDMTDSIGLVESEFFENGN